MLQNVKPNWNETDSTSDAYILNKPTIPAAQVQADWDESDSSDVTFIKNKPAIPDITDYLCFTAAEINASLYLGHTANVNQISLEVSNDKVNWRTYDWEHNEVIQLVNIGDKVYFRGDNNTLGSDYSKYFRFEFNKKFYATGNIMSLLSKDCSKTEVPNFCFSNFFKQDGIIGKLLSAPKLPFTKVGNTGCANMFRGCSGLTEAPELSATELSYNCYYGMFINCTGLKFAPKLPALDLSGGRCYGEMFSGCTGLLSAELPATTLGSNCYDGMFKQCTSLKSVKCNFSTWTGTNNWFQNASSTGVFECPSALNISSRDASHIPSGWTIIRTDAPWSDWSQTDTTEASYVKNRNISAETTSSDATYTVNAGDATTPVLTVASALTLSAGTVTAGKIAYAEVVIDLASGATVTAGSNITFVDTLTAGKRNVCVVRWSGGTAKLYVTIVEDLDESASN